MQGFVKRHTAPGAKVYTDDATAYESLPFDHATVKHSLSEYVKGDVHTNGIESLWSMLKRAHKGTFHKLSPKHLDRYIQEFAGRHCPASAGNGEQRSAVKLTEGTHEKTRKRYTAQEKVAILRRHLVDKEPVSKLCDELALQPTVFYRWQKEFFENGAVAFQTSNRRSRQPEQERIERLEKKIQTKDEVLAELMAEHMALKKSLGEL